MQDLSETGTKAAGFTRTRIAPTPSGYLHLGNVLSFALTAVLAERYGARILLRIDDMDRGRFDLKYVRDIFDTLHFLEIPWQEGPRDEQSFVSEYSQMHRLDQYRHALDELRQRNAVFACDCSRSFLLKNDPGGRYLGYCRHKGLSLDSEAACWRLSTGSLPLKMKTLSGVREEPLPAGMNYFVVRKKDKYPAYQLSSIVDDLYFGVDLIVRGEDLFPSTLAQCYLARQMGRDAFLQSTFCHHSLIRAADGMKLSKSAGATSIRYLRREGKKPSDIYTLIGNQSGIPGRLHHWRDLAVLLP